MKLNHSLARTFRLCAVALPALMAFGTAQSHDDDNLWTSAGQNIRNTRHQSGDSHINPGTEKRLAVKWAFTTEGDVSATPAVDDTHVYAPDWAGNLYAVNRNTGAKLWQVKISTATGIPFDKARTTPVVSGNKLILGTQGSILVPGGGPGGRRGGQCRCRRGDAAGYRRHEHPERKYDFHCGVDLFHADGVGA